MAGPLTTLIDSNDAILRYDPPSNWKYSGTTKYASLPQSQVVVPFYGNRIEVYGYTNSFLVNCRLDGRTFPSTYPSLNSSYFCNYTLPLDNHTLTITNGNNANPIYITSVIVSRPYPPIISDITSATLHTSSDSLSESTLSQHTSTTERLVLQTTSLPVSSLPSSSLPSSSLPTSSSTLGVISPFAADAPTPPPINRAQVIGGVFGGLTLVIIIVIVVALFIRRSHKRNKWKAPSAMYLNSSGQKPFSNEKIPYLLRPS